MNAHREEVLIDRNRPRSEFSTQEDFDKFVEESAALAHDLNDDDEQIVSKAVEKLRSGSATTTNRRFKVFTAKVNEAVASQAEMRVQYEAAVRNATERQIQWLKRNRKGRKNNKALDYSLFTTSDTLTKKQRRLLGLGPDGKPIGKSGAGAGAEGGGGRGGGGAGRNTLSGQARKRQQDEKLPPKPKRKYKFTGDEAPRKKSQETVPIDDYRAAGFRRKWERIRFMADIEGAWD